MSHRTDDSAANTTTQPVRASAPRQIARSGVRVATGIRAGTTWTNLTPSTKTASDDWEAPVA